jgi:hypothetical protein
LQVDAVDRVHRSGWSVLVFGIATAVDDPEEIARLDGRGLRWWAASERASWIRLLPVEVTGRRLPRAWSHPDPIRWVADPVDGRRGRARPGTKGPGRLSTAGASCRRQDEPGRTDEENPACL